SRKRILHVEPATAGPRRSVHKVKTRVPVSPAAVRPVQQVLAHKPLSAGVALPIWRTLMNQGIIFAVIAAWLFPITVEGQTQQAKDESPTSPISAIRARLREELL